MVGNNKFEKTALSKTMPPRRPRRWIWRGVVPALTVLALAVGTFEFWLRAEQAELPTGVPQAPELSVPVQPANEAEVASEPSIEIPENTLESSADPELADERAEDFNYAHELLAKIMGLGAKDGKYSAAQIDEINTALRDLAELTMAAVPAIHEYLESSEDIDLTQTSDSQAANYSTLRRGLIDALHQIGGPQAVEALGETLETTVEVGEIAMLARSIELHAPGAYRPELLTAAQESLRQAEQKGMRDREIGLLFAVFERYGNKDAAAQLEESFPRWSLLSAMALAGMQGGEGVATLMQIAREGAETPKQKEAALQMLAQATRVHPQASEALLEIARSGELQQTDWSVIATRLWGHEYRYDRTFFQDTEVDGPLNEPAKVIPRFHLDAAAQWSDSEIDQRVGLIDALLKTGPDPNAAQSLEDSRSHLKRWRHKPLIDGRRRAQ